VHVFCVVFGCLKEKNRLLKNKSNTVRVLDSNDPNYDCKIKLCLIEILLICIDVSIIIERNLNCCLLLQIIEIDFFENLTIAADEDDQVAFNVVALDPQEAFKKGFFDKQLFLCLKRVFLYVAEIFLRHILFSQIYRLC
jgi:hypothetical protein